MAEKKFELKPSRGQHLLRDKDVEQQLVDAVPSHHTVIEVGAGPGNITRRLAEKSRKVIADKIVRYRS